MTADLRDTVVRVALPAFAILVILRVARQRRLSFREDLGLQFPSYEKALLWVAVFVALMVVQELLWKALGLPPPEPWRNKYTGVMKIVRVFAMAVLAPVSEELLFRGIIYHTIAVTPLKDAGAIAITSVAFAVLHFQYGIGEMSFILFDAVFYGIVRCSTGSTGLTMIMHVLGNSYAAYQRLSP